MSNIVKNTHWEIYSENAIDRQNGELKRLVESTDLSIDEQITILDVLAEEICAIVDKAVVSMELSADQEKAYFAQRAHKLIQEFFDTILNNRKVQDVIENLLSLKDKLQEDQLKLLQALSAQFLLFKNATNDYELYNAEDLFKKLKTAKNQYVITIGDHDLDQIEITDFAVREALFKMKAHKYTVSRDRKTYFNFSKESLDFVFKNSNSDAVKKFIYEGKYKVDNGLERKFQDVFETRRKAVSYIDKKEEELAPFLPFLSREEQFSFLENVHSATIEKATEEKERIISEKKATATYPIPKQIDVFPWDQTYYDHQFSNALIRDKIDQYLSLETVLEGIYSLLGEVFGVKIEQTPIGKDEVWHSSVIKLSVNDSQTGNTGVIYLDLFQRPFKYETDTVFPIQLISKRQKHAIVSICSQLKEGQQLLSLQDTETLFTHFGDALHSICSESNYFYSSGPRCYADLQETPGLLLSHFASDARVLQRFAKHHQTGETIPEHVISNAVEAKKQLNATKIQWQIYISMLDHHLTNRDADYEKVSQMASNLMQQYTNIKYPSNTTWHFYQEQLVLNSTVQFASLYQAFNSWKIWNTCFASNPFDQKMAQKFKSQALSKSTVQPPKLMLELTGETTGQDYSNFVNSAILPKRFHSFN